MNIEKHRQQFPGLTDKVYLNFGGQGIMPNAVLSSIIDCHKYIQEQGPFSLKVNLGVEQRMADLRKDMAAEIGATPSQIALTENTTVGCNIVLWGINWQPGDHILMTDCEHNGVIAIVQEIARRFQVEVSTCPIMDTLNQGDPVEVIGAHLQPNTRLVILSHILWNTGQVLPLAEITALCHQQKVPVLVDGAQSVGMLPLNLLELGVDFYSFTGHKWLCGPVGVGGLYVKSHAMESIQPTFIGWRGVNLGDRGEPVSWLSDARRFEVASSAYPLYEGLRGAMATHSEWGTARERYEQICALSAYLWEGLREIKGVKCLKDSPPEAGLVSFQVTGNISSQELVHSLERWGFLLRTLADPDCVRACVHYFNLREEIDQLVEKINCNYIV